MRHDPAAAEGAVIDPSPAGRCIPKSHNCNGFSVSQLHFHTISLVDNADADDSGQVHKQRKPEVPRAFVIYGSNLNSFIIHGIGVNNPSPKNAVRIIAGAVEHQSIANPDSGVVLVDVSAKPQLRLYFFDPLSDGTATAATSVVEDITGTQGWSMSHHDSMFACI